jgi:hypothetical protein
VPFFYFDIKCFPKHNFQEANKKFTIVVEATDQAVSPFSPLTSKAQVIVNVLDTQNTAPEVKLTPIQQKVSVYS